MNKKYSKISPTAVFCARMRAKQDIPFAKEVVELIDTKYCEDINDLPDYRDTLTSKSNNIPFIEGRYYSLNRALLDIDNAFIVEIASGLSPRSLNFLNKKNVIYLETELSELIKIKERILRDIITKMKLKDENLLFMSINPLEIEDMDRIGKVYLEKGKDKRLIVIHEGLLMYFNKKEKTKFRDNIHYLFKKYAPDGLWLTSDLSRFERKPSEVMGGENIRDKISKITNREFNYFNSEDETKKFLIEGGFSFEVLSNIESINLLIHKKSFQLNKSAILESAKNYRIWKIQLL